MSDVMSEDEAKKLAASMTKINAELRCLAAGGHQFVFLRQTTEEVSWHNWKTYDVFFCRKCLKHQRVEVPKPQEHRG